MLQSMTQWMLTGLMALAAPGAMAVLDVGSPTAEAPKSVSPFAGSWSGTWFHIEDEMVGTIDMTISNAGQITGWVYNATDGGSGALVGHVRANGNLVMIGFVPNDEPAGGSGFPHLGTAVIDGEGMLDFSITATWPGGPSGVGTLERN